MEKIKIGDSVYSVSRGEWKKGKRLQSLPRDFFIQGSMSGRKGIKMTIIAIIHPDSRERGMDQN